MPYCPKSSVYQEPPTPKPHLNHHCNKGGRSDADPSKSTRVDGRCYRLLPPSQSSPSWLSGVAEVCGSQSSGSYVNPAVTPDRNRANEKNTIALAQRGQRTWHSSSCTWWNNLLPFPYPEPARERNRRQEAQPPPWHTWYPTGVLPLHQNYVALGKQRLSLLLSGLIDKSTLA
jgi:hypothetical protein